MKAEILVGVSASGKSTYAAERCAEGNVIALDRDDMRFSLRKVRDWDGYKFSKPVEAMVTEMQISALHVAAKKGFDVVIAETNLNPRTRKKWEGLCRDVGYEVVFIPMHITLDEAIKRNQLRDNGLPEEVILKQWVQWENFLGYFYE